MNITLCGVVVGLLLACGFIAVPMDASLVVSAFAEDDHGALLITTAGEIRRLVNGKFERAYPLPGTSTIRPSHLLRDRDGGLWITSREGVIHVHEGRTDTFGSSDGLSGSFVVALMEDREGNIWAVTTEGLDRFRRRPVATMSRIQGLPEPPISVLGATDGSVWFATRRGVYRWRAEDSTILQVNDKIAALSLFQDDRGRIWTSTSQQVGYLSGTQFVPFRGVPSGIVYSVAQDSQGNIWLKYQDPGLTRITPGGAVQQIPWSTFNNKLAVTVRTDSRQGQSGTWLGFVGGGIAYFADDQVKASYTSADGLPAASVNDIVVERDGTVWAATGAGLSRLKDGRAATITSLNGLPCANVHAVVEDDTRSFWLMMSCGIVRIPRRQLDLWAADVDARHDPSRRIEALVLDNSDGADMGPGAGGVRPLAAKASDGRLWFRALDGANVVDPHGLPLETIPTPVRIEQIAADGLAYDVFSSNGTTRSLPPLVHDVRIEYTALSFTAPDRIRFRYKLEGFDPDWQDAGNRRQAFYTNLPPRRYRFSVIAANNSGVWSETGATVDFAIAAAYYQTNWFRALALSMVVGFVWAAHRIRLRMVETHEREISALNERLMKAQEQERMRIAGELHDGVMQQMLSVTMMLGSAKRRVASNPTEAAATIEKVQEKLIQAGTDIRQLSHGLHPPILQEAGLPEAVRSYCEEFSTARGIPVTCNADERARELSCGAALALFRVLQEALGNAAKHGSPGQITVALARTNGDVSLTVSDDGAGFDAGGTGASGLGLVMMRERASQLNGTFHVASTPGRGTTISVVIPFR